MAGVLALVGCGLLMLATTQPWSATVTEPAPGGPRWRGSVAGEELVPWLGPVAAVAGLAVVAVLARLAWARWAAGPALGAAVVGAVHGLLGAGVAGGTTVSARPTAWPWVALASAGGALVATALLRPGRGGREPRGGRRPAPGRPAWDEERRRTAEDWRAVSEGLEPGEDPGWHNEG